MSQQRARNRRQPMHELSASERNQILGARDAGISIGHIVAQFRRPKNSNVVYGVLGHLFQLIL